VGLLGLPVSAGIAVLRYRLWDIDHIVSRTVSYALVTALLAGVFAVTVIGLQLLAPITNGNTIAVAAATLASASLFQPLRGRVQRAVDRRFNRATVDADRIALEFADRVREQVDISSVLGALASSIERTVQPASTSVWIREGGR
jgi:hypothetical protein